VNAIDTIGESPISLVLAALTVVVVIGREIALASRNSRAVRAARALFVPYLVLLATFVVIVVARVALVVD